MQPNKKQALIDRFPEMFDGCWEVAIGDGWYDILKNLCEKVEEVGLEDFKFIQIKEKFGTLRIYASDNNDETYKLIDGAELASAITCENCGLTGNSDVVTCEGSWLKTLCKPCRGERNKKKGTAVP